MDEVAEFLLVNNYQHDWTLTHRLAFKEHAVGDLYKDLEKRPPLSTHSLVRLRSVKHKIKAMSQLAESASRALMRQGKGKRCGGRGYVV